MEIAVVADADLLDLPIRWQSYVPENFGGEEERITRRRFVRSSGGATVAAVLSWHSLQILARAEVPGGSGVRK